MEKSERIYYELFLADDPGPTLSNLRQLVRSVASRTAHNYRPALLACVDAICSLYEWAGGELAATKAFQQACDELESLVSSMKTEVVMRDPEMQRLLAADDECEPEEAKNNGDL